MKRKEAKVVSGTPISDDDIKNILTGMKVIWQRTGLKYLIFSKCHIERTRMYDQNKEGVVIIGNDNAGNTCIHAVSNLILKSEFKLIRQ